MKLFKKISVLFLTLLFFGCGKDGSSGKSFVALDWDWYVDAYSDNNPSIPSTISKNFDYSSGVGSYKGIYQCSNGSGSEWYWEFTYKTSVNSGEEGKLFKSGDNGKNKHYKLYLDGLNNASITVTEKSTYYLQKPKKNKIPKINFDFYPKNKKYIGEEIVETFVQNGLIIEFKRRMFIIK
jgi:hypothetical protein